MGGPGSGRHAGLTSDPTRYTKQDIPRIKSLIKSGNYGGGIRRSAKLAIRGAAKHGFEGMRRGGIKHRAIIKGLKNTANRNWRKSGYRL